MLPITTILCCLLLLLSTISAIVRGFPAQVDKRPTLFSHQNLQSQIAKCAVLLGIGVTAALTPDTVLAITTADAKVTSKVKLDISIASAKPRQITLGLFGEAAPEATKLFRTICEGDLRYSVGYSGAQVSAVVKDEYIDVNKFAKGADKKTESYRNEAGVVRLRSLDLSSEVKISDTNDLRHDIDGVLSVQKGGGSFGFTIAPRPNPSLDDENIVIGRVLTGQEVVKDINDVPITKEDPLGSKTTFSNLGKFADGRAKMASVNKPLKKIRIAACTIAG